MRLRILLSGLLALGLALSALALGPAPTRAAAAAKDKAKKTTTTKEKAPAGKDKAKSKTGAGATAAVADDSAVAPFIGADTVIVGRADLTNIDVNAIHDWIKPLPGKAGLAADELAEAPNGLDVGMREMASFLDAFKAAGGSKVYMVLTMEQIDDDGPALIVPLGEGADAEKMTRLLKTGKADPTPQDLKNAEQWGPAVVAVGDVLLFGEKSSVDLARNTKPVEVPELAEALAAGGDGPVQLAMIATPQARKQFLQLVPGTLPDELGGAKTADLVNSIKWAAAGATSPPEGSITLTIQATDDAAAEKLSELIGASFTAARNEEDVQEIVTAEEIDQAVTLLTPKVEGDRLTLTWAQAEVDQATEIWASAMERMMANFRRDFGGPQPGARPKANEDKGGL